MPQFRFVFLADSDVRLMPNAGDSPAAWAFEHGSTERVLVRDVLDHINGVPRHQKLCLNVVCEGGTLDDHLHDHARALAETTLILLSASSRAPTGDVEFFVAYETTPNENGRAFLQWLPASELPAPRTPAPHELMGEIWDAIQRAAAADAPLAQRVVLSMSWYRRAIRETEPLFRFTNLWLSLEALNPRLADAFEVSADERQGLSGVRRLLEELTGDRKTFRAAVKARQDILHVKRVLPVDVRRRVEPLLVSLDDAVAAGWRRLLSVPDRAAGPAAAVWPYPNRFIIRARLQPDAEGWSDHRHPWFDQELNITAREPAAPGKVTYDQSPKWTMQNAEDCTELSYELRGPVTPNPPHIEPGTEDAMSV